MSSSSERGKDGVQQLMRGFAEGFFTRPSVKMLRAAVPIGDHVVQVARDDGVVGNVEQARLLTQREGGRLALQGEKRGDDDGKKADQAADERRSVGEAVLQQKTHDRQRDAGGGDEKHAAPVEEAAGHEHDDDVKDRDGEPKRRKRIDGENRRGKTNGDEGEENSRGE